MKAIDAQFVAEGGQERSVVVLLVLGGETFDAKLDMAKKHMGRNAFVAVVQDQALAGNVLSEFGAKPTTDVALAPGALFIVTQSGTSVTAESPPYHAITTSDELYTWIFSAR